MTARQVAAVHNESIIWRAPTLMFGRQSCGWSWFRFKTSLYSTRAAARKHYRGAFRVAASGGFYCTATSIGRRCLRQRILRLGTRFAHARCLLPLFFRPTKLAAHSRQSITSPDQQCPQQIDHAGLQSNFHSSAAKAQLRHFYALRAFP